MTSTTMGKIGAALVLIGVGAVSLSGCGGGCHDRVHVSWRLVDAGNNVFHCEDVGATKVLLNMGGAITTFNCTDYEGLTTTVPTGTYATALQLQDAAGKVLSQTDSMSVPVSGCGTFDLGAVDFEVTPPCGKQDVSLTWSIVQDATNQPLTCAQVGASTVRLNLGTNMYNFDCSAMAGITEAVAEGSYPTYLQLFSQNNQVLSMTGTMNITVPHCAGVTLPAIEFGVQ